MKERRIIMKKVIVAMMLMAMTATTVAGCGSNDTAADTTTETAAEDTTADTADAAEDTAADTAGDQSFAVRRCLLTGRSGLTKSPDDRQQCDRTDDISNGIEGKASNIVHADALCDKSHTPDGGCQQQKQRIFKLCLFHKIPSLHSNIGKRQLFNRHTDTKQRNICNHIMRKEKKEARIRRVQILFGDFLGFSIDKYYH